MDDIRLDANPFDIARLKASVQGKRANHKKIGPPRFFKDEDGRMIGHSRRRFDLHFPACSGYDRHGKRNNVDRQTAAENRTLCEYGTKTLYGYDEEEWYCLTKTARRKIIRAARKHYNPGA